MITTLKVLPCGCEIQTRDTQPVDYEVAYCCAHAGNYAEAIKVWSAAFAIAMGKTVYEVMEGAP